MPLRVRNAVVLVKPESTPGVDAAPVAGTDAVLVEVTGNPFSFDPNVIQTNEVTGSLDGRGAIIGGMRASLRFRAYMKGAAAPGTTAPEWGKLLKACGCSETLTAAAVGGPTAATAGTGTTVTAQAPFGTTQDQYKGMPLHISGTPAAAYPIITGYTTGRVATLTDLFNPVLSASAMLQIPPNALYKPASTGISNHTIWMYLDGLLYKFVGAIGTAQMSIGSGGPGMFDFTFSGLFTSKTDAAVPTATYDTTRPPVWRDSGGNDMSNALLDRVKSGIASFSLDLGNTIAYPENPSNLEGLDPPLITARRITGSVDPIEELVATRDLMARFRAQTQIIMHARLGDTAGNRLALTVPNALILNQAPGDRQGLATVTVPFEAVGQDSGFYLAVY